MTLRSCQAAALLACTLGATACSAIPAPARLGIFSFDYLFVGGGVARPVQVFDDGVRTYLHYRAGVPAPALVSADGQQLFLPRQQGPYVVIDAVPRDLIAQLGASRVRITHASIATNAVQVSPQGRTVVPAVPAPSSATAAAPGFEPTGAKSAGHVVGENGWTDNSYATPLRGDRIEWRHRDEVLQDFSLRFPARSTGLPPDAARMLQVRAPVLAGATRIQVVGREDGSHREGLGAGRAAAVVDHLVAAGIPRSRIAIQVAQEARDGSSNGNLAGARVTAFAARVYAPPNLVAATAARVVAGSTVFRLRASDTTLAANLRRWASDQGWRVVVKDAPDVKVVGDADVEQPGFLAAAEFAIAQARLAGYPIRAAAHANNVLVLLREAIE